MPRMNDDLTDRITERTCKACRTPLKISDPFYWHCLECARKAAIRIPDKHDPNEVIGALMFALGMHGIKNLGGEGAWIIEIAGATPTQHRTLDAALEERLHLARKEDL